MSRGREKYAARCDRIKTADQILRRYEDRKTLVSGKIIFCHGDRPNESGETDRKAETSAQLNNMDITRRYVVAWLYRERWCLRRDHRSRTRQ